MRWYALSASTSSSASGDCVLDCNRDRTKDFLCTGASSESDPSLAESALLCEESLESDFRRAANSPIRGFKGAEAASEDALAMLRMYSGARRQFENYE